MTAARWCFFFGIQKELTENDRGADNRISGDNLTVVQNLVQRDLALILTSLREPAAADEMSTRRELEALARVAWKRCNWSTRKCA